MPFLTPTGTAEKADYINAVFLPVHTYIITICLKKVLFQNVLFRCALIILKQCRICLVVGIIANVKCVWRAHKMYLKYML